MVDDTLSVLNSADTDLLCTPCGEDMPLFKPAETAASTLLYMLQDGSVLLIPVTYISQSSVSESIQLPEISDNCNLENVVVSPMNVGDTIEAYDSILSPSLKHDSTLNKLSEPDGNGPYTCGICDKAFDCVLKYIDHLQVHSQKSAKGVLECSQCEDKVTFSSPTKLSLHKKQFHFNPRPFVCSEPGCNLSFDKASELSYHKRRNHDKERPYVCKICKKSFFKRSDLKTHLIIHSDVSGCVCEVCGRKFNHISNLARHTRSHSGVRPYPCSICGRRFNQLNTLCEHQFSHASSVLCDVCGKMYKNMNLLRKHFKLKHNIQMDVGESECRRRRYHCKVCGETFPFIQALRHHEKSHNSFDCKHCFLAFDTIEELKQHSCNEGLSTLEELKQHSSSEGLPAMYFNLGDGTDGIDEMFTEGTLDVYRRPDLNLDMIDGFQVESDLADNADTLTTQDVDNLVYQVGNLVPDRAEIDSLDSLLNKEVLNPTSCKDFNSDDIYEFLTQQVSVTDQEILDVPTPLSVGSSAGDNSTAGDTQCFDISNCDKRVKKLSDHKQRLVTDQKILNVPTTLSVESSAGDSSTSDGSVADTQYYHCSICDKRFKKLSNFKQHLGVHDDSRKKYSCEICAFSFAWKSTLNKHLVKHNENTPQYKCSSCNKIYSSPILMQAHIRRDHLKHRPHTCNVCKKSFFKKHDLKIHQRTHTQERPYTCGTCHRSFGHVSHLLRHRRLHNIQRIYECKICCEKFMMLPTLISHMRKHEKEDNLESYTNEI